MLAGSAEAPHQIGGRVIRRHRAHAGVLRRAAGRQLAGPRPCTPASSARWPPADRPSSVMRAGSMVTPDPAGAGLHPADRALHVAGGGLPVGLGLDAVLDVEHREALLAQPAAGQRRLALVAAGPAAAVDDDHRRHRAWPGLPRAGGTRPAPASGRRRVVCRLSVWSGSGPRPAVSIRGQQEAAEVDVHVARGRQPGRLGERVEADRSTAGAANSSASQRQFWLRPG